MFVFSTQWAHSWVESRFCTGVRSIASESSARSFPGSGTRPLLVTRSPGNRHRSVSQGATHCDSALDCWQWARYTHAKSFLIYFYVIRAQSASGIFMVHVQVTEKTRFRWADGHIFSVAYHQGRRLHPAKCTHKTWYNDQRIFKQTERLFIEVLKIRIQIIDANFYKQCWKTVLPF